MPVIEQKTTNKNKVDFDLNRLDKSKTTIFSKYPTKTGSPAMPETLFSAFHAFSQKRSHGLGQLALRVTGQAARVGDEQHRAQHISLTQHGGGHGGGERLVVLTDAGHGAQPGEVVDAALRHELFQLIGDGLAQQLPLAGACHGDDGVPVGDSGGKIGAAAQRVAELDGEVLQPADQGVLLEDDLAIPCGVDLQRVALADTHGAADLLGDDDTSQIIDPAHDPGCFHI